MPGGSDSGRVAAREWRSVLAWILAGLSVAALATAVVLVGVAGGDALRAFGEECGFVVFALVGATIVTRRPDNAIGWVMIGAGISFAGTAVTTAYADASLAGIDLPGAVWAAWTASWLWSPGWAFAFGWLPLLFPDGRVLSRRWRPLAWLMAIGTLQVVPAALLPRIVYGSNDDIVFGANPIGIASGGPLLETLVEAAATLFVPVWLAMVVMQVLRYRRADRIQRLQMRWFLWASGVTIGLILASVAPAVSTFLNSIPMGPMVALMPVSVGLAVTRYKLYEIDRVISRTVTYAVVLALLVGVYVTGVLAFGAVLRPVTGDSDLTVAISTLVAAAAFRPVLGRVRSRVERRFDRQRYDAAAAVAAFSQRLRDQIDLGQIENDLTDLSRRTVQPSQVTVWLATRA